MMGDGWGDGGWGWGAWVFMALMMVMFAALVAAVVIALVRSGGRAPITDTPAGTAETDNAARILDERFARGEIDADEYRSRRDLIRSG